MVTKLASSFISPTVCSVLAKIHMVTKQERLQHWLMARSVLAKIHMVTKPQQAISYALYSSVLAKIHMVTKLVKSC